MSIQIIGAGYGRTGTKSLQIALEQLGYDKCYHMEELISNPDGVEVWEDAFSGKTPQWSKLFKEYQSIVDFPGSLQYESLLKTYPDAKVILTVRDAEKWFASANATIFSFDPGIGLKLRLLLKLPFSARARKLLRVVKLINDTLWKTQFEGKVNDKAYMIQRYNDHIEAVKKAVPASQLLIFEVKDGWGPLCAFLGKDVPDQEFPRTNKQEDFATWSKKLFRDSLG